MSNKDKNKEQDPNKSAQPEFRDAAPKPIIPAEDDVNPLKDDADLIADKDQADKTPQEEFVEGAAQVKEYRDAASAGGPDSGSGPSGDSAGLKTAAEIDKEITPPETADEPVVDDYDFLASDDVEDVPFEPIPDAKARLHGTHDGAMAGLQTDLSGSYIPPGLAKNAQDAAAERANQARLERAAEQREEQRHDNSERRTRL